MLSKGDTHMYTGVMIDFFWIWNDWHWTSNFENSWFLFRVIISLFGLVEIPYFFFFFFCRTCTFVLAGVSAATPLPIQFVPFLEDTLDKVKQCRSRRSSVLLRKLSSRMRVERRVRWRRNCSLKVCLVIYIVRSPAHFTILSLISHANIRVYRPRVIIHGPISMGRG